MVSEWDFLGSQIPNPDPWDSDSDRDFLFWARSKNLENPEIPGIGIGILKSRKNSEKIPSAKSRKSQNPGDWDPDLKIPKNSE